jgi:hypothetical protein
MIMHAHPIALALTAAALFSAPAGADSQPQSGASTYRGTFVCEKSPGAADILHVPLDVAVRGDNVEFARPLFNLRGTRVLGSELGAGSIDPDGKVHLTSSWDVRGIVVHGDYSGTLKSSGGTLTGTQSWHDPAGEARSRTCQAALVPAPDSQQQTMK